MGLIRKFRRWRRERRRLYEERLSDPRHNHMLAQVLWYEEQAAARDRTQAAIDEMNRKVRKEGY